MDTQIEVDRVSLSFGGMKVLDNVSFSVSRNEFLLITGPNGGGKTSLLRIILGLQPPVSGKVTFFSEGRRVHDLNIGYLPQKNSIDRRFPITVSEVVLSGLSSPAHLVSRPSETDRQRVAEVISMMGLSGLEDRPIGQLSGGQMQRVLFGRAIVKKPAILILDEPSSYLDKPFEQQMYELLKELNYSATVLIVSHEVGSLEGMADKILKVNKQVEQLR